MNKLDMAHEYFMKHGRNNSWMESDVIDAWKYADAMQAEADKREVSIEEAMKEYVHDYIYGRVCACGKVKDVEEEWQPDWSQAPNNALTWAINSDGYASWALYKDGHYFSTVQAPSFGYQGNCQDSLRKRPQ